MDYAVRKGVSLSTLRRHIKANKIQYKVENGRYLLFDGDAEIPHSPAPAAASVKEEPRDPQSSAMLQAKLQKVERDLRQAQEEIAELKMLIALYEEKMSTSH
jgi:hypothetical protein